MLTEEMEDATEKMNEMSEELNIYREKEIEFKGKSRWYSRKRGNWEFSIYRND